MAEILEMPKLSDTMIEGVIASWNKKVGEEVASGELLAEIETDKATMDLESFFDGVLLHIGGKEGDSIAIGDLLAIIGEKGEDVSAIVEEYKNKAAASENGQEEAKEEAPAKEEPKTVAPPTPVPAVAAVTATAVSPSSNGDRLKASPLAKAIAREQGIDIRQVPGSGDHGRIIKRDVEAFIESGGAQAAAPSFRPAIVGQESFSEVSVSQMRKTIARRLSESKFTAPHFYLTMEIDMDKAVEARKSINEMIAPGKISFNDMVVKAAAAALRQHPKVNSSWLGDRIRYNDHVHVGVAVAVEDGLLVPVIRFADSKGLTQISAETKDLAGKARDKKLQPHEWEGNTFTISNLGMYGIEEFTAIINPPDACIMAVGGIVEKPVVKNGQIVPGKTMKVTLSCDHRVVDGATGSEFLRTFKNLLEDPVRILV